MMNRMRALVIEQQGDLPELKEAPDARPRPGEVLVKVAAAGLNYADTMVRRGFYVAMPAFPHIPGLEFCGTVAELGEGAGRFRPGDRVMGLGQHTLAEFVAVPENALLPVPAGFTDEDAAAFPVTYLTAWGMLRISAHAQAGETILIHAAAGGVGTAAIQLAKHLGLRVIGAAGTEDKAEIARRTGADIALDYSRADYVDRVLAETGGCGADIIFESVGAELAERTLKAAAPFARIVVFGMASGQLPRLEVGSLFSNSIGISAFWLVTLVREPEKFSALAKELLEVVGKTGLKPVIGAVYSFADGAEVFQKMESRRTWGKIVLTP
jgi:NADPH2:quinone reductase